MRRQNMGSTPSRGTTQNKRQQRQQQRQPPPPPVPLWSTPTVPDSYWSSEDFMLGAGMVIFQPSTWKVVVVFDKERKYWFLPRGRKDLGESLETTALREAYEESGYRATFLPLYKPTHQPASPSDPQAYGLPNTEPVCISTYAWRGTARKTPGEYLIHWYTGQIPEDAVREEGTGMPDEQNYVGYLLSFEDALKALDGVQPELGVLEYSIACFQNHCQILERFEGEALASAGTST